MIKLTRDILNDIIILFIILQVSYDNPEKQGGMLHGKTIFCGVKDLLNLQI